MDKILIAVISIIVTWLSLRKKHQQDIALLKLKHDLDLSKKRLEIVFDIVSRLEEVREIADKNVILGIAYVDQRPIYKEYRNEKAEKSVKSKLKSSNIELGKADGILNQCKNSTHLLGLTRSRENLDEVIQAITELMKVTAVALIEKDKEDKENKENEEDMNTYVPSDAFSKAGSKVDVAIERVIAGLRDESGLMGNKPETQNR